MEATRRPGDRAGLDRAAVLAAARELADAEGPDALTMRRLAAALGVMPNSLYSYFPSKAALLDDLLDSVLADVEVPDPESVTWTDGLERLFAATRSVLLAHPGLVGAYTSRPALGPNAIRLGEATLALLRRGGVEGRAAVHALRALLIFTLGFASFEAPRRADPDPEARSARGQAAFASAPAESFPNTRRAAAHLGEHPTDVEFGAGLRWLVAGIAADASAVA
jgi:AcrR family transcriptional regulator